MTNSSKGVDAVKLDKNMAIGSIDGKELQWFSLPHDNIDICGLPWFEKERRFRRLPQNPTHHLRDAVDKLANCTAGAQLRFASDCSDLALRVKLAGPASMYHMPATGQCGFDCYIEADNEYHYFSTARFSPNASNYDVMLCEELDQKRNNFVLNFPLYQGVDDVQIGINPEANLFAPPALADNKPIVIYGTSITQGGCASRPGMAYTNILSRRLNREFINLGFSGNGRGEPELAHIIREIPSPACYLLDYDANVGSAQAMQETLPPFINILREKHPQVPIVVVSRPPVAKEFMQGRKNTSRLDKKQVQKDTVKECIAAGDKNIQFIDGESLMGKYFWEGSVDGSHPTDLGFWWIANALEPVLRKVLSA